MVNMDMILLSMFFGLIVGSFLNVVAMRMLSGENVAYPPSHCTFCNHKLGFFDLFPVFSYVFLQGKCRYCKEKISFIYPFGEILTSISYGVVVYHYGFSMMALINIVFITTMIVATVTDLKETMVPDRVIVVGYILVLLLRIIQGEALFSYLGSSIMSFLLLFAIFVLSFGRMGGADVKIYALIGLAIGFSDAVATLFYASLISILYHAPFLIKGTWDRDREIPFIPFITVAILITYYINLYNLLPH